MKIRVDTVSVDAEGREDASGNKHGANLSFSEQFSCFSRDTYVEDYALFVSPQRFGALALLNGRQALVFWERFA
jgi:hypothetical protein